MPSYVGVACVVRNGQFIITATTKWTEEVHSTEELDSWMLKFALDRWPIEKGYSEHKGHITKEISQEEAVPLLEHARNADETEKFGTQP